MKNWQDYVGLLPTTPPPVALVCKYDDNDQVISLTTVPVEVECTLTSDEVGIEVERLLNSFPICPVELFDTMEGTREWPPELRLCKIQNAIAAQTRRGAGNTRWNDIMYYHGSCAIDNPIIVAEDDGKYGIFIHPHFEKYGYQIP